MATQIVYEFQATDGVTPVVDKVVNSVDKLEKTVHDASAGFSGLTKEQRAQRRELRQTQGAYERLRRQLDPAYDRVQRMEQAQRTLDRALKHQIITLDRYEKEIRQVNRAFREHNKEVRGTMRWLQPLRTEITGLSAGLGTFGIALNRATTAWGAAAVAIGGAVFGIIQAGDQVGLLRSRVESLTGSTAAFNQLRDTASNLGMALTSTTDVFARFAIAGSDINLTTQEVNTLTQTVLQLGRIGGGTAQELAAGSRQLAQGLASGRLQGDELRSVLENMPLVARAIAEEFGVSVERLRRMGAEGQVTSDRVAGALLNVAERTNEEYADLSLRSEAYWARIGIHVRTLGSNLDLILGLSDLWKTVLDAVGNAFAWINRQVEALAEFMVEWKLLSQETLDVMKGVGEENKVLGGQMAENVELSKEQLRIQKEIRKSYEATNEAIAQEERRNAMLEAQLDGNEELVDLLEEQEEIRKATSKIKDIEVEQGKELTEEQRQYNEYAERARRSVADQIRANRELEKAVEAKKKAEEEATKELEKQQKLLEENIRDISDDLAGVWVDSAGDAQKAWEGFGEWLRGYVDDLMKEVIARQLFDPILRGAFGLPGGGGVPAGGTTRVPVAGPGIIPGVVGGGMASSFAGPSAFEAAGGAFNLVNLGAGGTLLSDIGGFLGIGGGNLAGASGMVSNAPSSMAAVSGGMPWGSIMGYGGPVLAGLATLATGGSIEQAAIQTALGVGGFAIGGPLGGAIGAVLGSFAGGLGGLFGGGRKNRESYRISPIAELGQPYPSVRKNRFSTFSTPLGEFIVSGDSDAQRDTADALQQMVEAIDTQVSTLLSAQELSNVRAYLQGAGSISAEARTFDDNAAGGLAMRRYAGISQALGFGGVARAIGARSSGMGPQEVGEMAGELLAFAINFDDMLDAMNQGLTEFGDLVGPQVAKSMFDATTMIEDFLEQTRELELDLPAAEEAVANYTRTLLGITEVEDATTAYGQEVERLTAILEQAEPLLEAANLEMEELFEALKRQIDELAAGFDELVARGIADIIGDISFAWQDLMDAQEGRIDEAIDANGDLQQVLRFNHLEQMRMVRQLNDLQLQGLTESTDAVLRLQGTLEQARRRALAGLQGQAGDPGRTLQDLTRALDRLNAYGQSLLVGGLSPLSPGAQLTEAERQLLDIAQRALAGDAQALNQLPDFASRFLQLSQQYFASTEEYVRDFEMVRDILDRTGQTTSELVDENERQLNSLLEQENILRTIELHLQGNEIDRALLEQQLQELRASGLATEEVETAIQDVIAAEQQLETIREDRHAELLDQQQQQHRELMEELDRIYEGIVNPPQPEPDVPVPGLPAGEQPAPLSRVESLERQIAGLRSRGNQNEETINRLLADMRRLLGDEGYIRWQREQFNNRDARAAGGYIQGPGTGTSDSIPAWLSDGEYVIRAAAVARVGVSALDRINEMGQLDGVRGFQLGGLVAGGRTAFGGGNVRIVDAIQDQTTVLASGLALIALEIREMRMVMLELLEEQQRTSRSLRAESNRARFAAAA